MQVLLHVYLRVVSHGHNRLYALSCMKSIEEIKMIRKSKLELTVSLKEKALVLAAAKEEEKSVATFMRDAIILRAQKVMK